MGEVTKQVRKFVERGKESAAIDALIDFLEPLGGDLYDEALYLSSKLRKYEKDKLLDLGERPEVESRISKAILRLANDIDESGLEDAPPSTLFTKPKSEPPPVQQQQQQASQPPQNNTPKYLAQCFFQGDFAQYFLAQDNSIWMFNPLTNQSMPIGTKMPSQDFRFAWTYMTATGVYYLVDHSGIIWGQNFGMPVQMGYVKML